MFQFHFQKPDAAQMLSTRLLTFLLLLLLALPLRANNIPTLTRDLTALDPDRSPAADSSPRTIDFLATELHRLTGQKPFRQKFQIVVPVITRCIITTTAPAKIPAATNPLLLLSTPPQDEIKTLPIFPFEPMGAQPPALKPEHEKLPLLYLGTGTLSELRGKKIANTFVALELHSEPLAWQNALALGARAILFLGDDQTKPRAFQDKLTNVPLSIPRFYCSDPATVNSIRAAEVTSLHIDIRVRWTERTAENILCLLPANFPATAAAKNQNRDPPLVILQARYDAASPILSQAPGATPALNTALALHLAQKIADAPQHAHVLIALTAADQWNNRGTHALYDLLGRGPGNYANPAAVDAALNRLLADAEKSRRDSQLTLTALTRLLNPDAAPNSSPDFSALRHPGTRDALIDELDRQASRLEEQLQQARIDRHPAAIATLDFQKRAFTSTASALKNSAELSPDARALTLDAAQRILPAWTLESLRRSTHADQLATWPAFRKTLPPRFPLLHISLALTAGSPGENPTQNKNLNLLDLLTPKLSPRFGFFARSDYSPQLDQTAPMAQFNREISRYANPTAAKNFRSTFADESTENRFPLQSFFPSKLAFSSDAALLRGQPAAAFATLRDASTFLDSPHDTFDHLHWPSLLPQIEDLARILVGTPQQPGALTDPLFYARAQIPNQSDNQKITFLERSLGETIPRLGSPLVLVGAENEINSKPLGPNLLGTRRIDWHLTSIDGSTHFSAAPLIGPLRLHAFLFDDRGLPTRTLAANQLASRGLISQFTPDSSRPQRAMLFDCQRLDAVGLFDPRYLEFLEHIDILDARRRDKAQYSNIYLRDGLAAVFMPPKIHWQLLAAKGSVSHRMVLINADSLHPDGQGFTTTDLVDIGPLPSRNASDLFTLNSQRQQDLQRHGISNEVIKDLQSHTAALLDQAHAARASHDYPTFFAASAHAWSLQSLVYQNLIDTFNGIIKGVIFLLLGIIPFSYFLERLLIGHTNVYKQIAWFAAFFALMTGLLWFHPAFRISTAPLMILLAFLILILSTTVVYILFGKFEEEIARLRGAAASAHSASLRRGAVIGAAIRLGLSNMRRRGARTSLTLSTLILLTFTLLCFTSVRESVQVTPRIIDDFTSHSAPPPSILIRQRAWNALPPAALQTLQTVSDFSTLHPNSPPPLLASRWWLSSEKAELPWLLPVTSPRSPTPFYANALLGLDPAEISFHRTPLASILNNFDHLAPDDLTCWLPTSAQSTFNLRVGDSVNILGFPLTIAGFFDNTQFSSLRQLTGDPLTPTDPSGAPPQLSSNANASPDDLAALPEAAYRFLLPSSVAIVPAKIARALNARLTSIILQPAPADPTPIFALAENIARQSAFTVYASDGSQVRSINASQSTQPQNLADVLIPMLIAGVIVLNTMLGAVAERTKEIHVYTSVGLAPSHVGMLFLAEAAALGTLGVVFGYIFGQGLATLLTKTGLLADVNLNYSSMSAVITMGLVLAIVMFSSLWPARAASRVATPSLQRDWRLPDPDGDTLRIELPFTVNQTAAHGVCAFLEEFLLTTSQSGTGRFTADNLKAFLDHLPSGTLRGLACRVWLAPYDLGVIQAFWLGIYPTPVHNIFEVKLLLVREAGNPAAWLRLNRPFLTEIRKQFLLWRALPEPQIQSYLTRSTTLFTPTPPPP